MRISASGMSAARTLLDVRANNIANVSTNGFRAQRAELRASERGGVEVASITEGEPDLVEDVVGLVVAKTMYSANAKAYAVRAETERALLDIRA